jgi:hypothetical protein
LNTDSLTPVESHHFWQRCWRRRVGSLNATGRSMAV